jgi:hypothetical protein
MIHLGKNLFERIPERLDEYRKIVPHGEKECVWAEAGVVPYKLCDSHFDCTNCSFDIVMRGGNELIPRRVTSRGGKLCPHRFYHHCHSWALVEEKAFVRVGIDDFGQNILGPIEKICLPFRDEKIGKKSIRIKARDSIISLMPPIDGYVEEVNDELIIQWFDVEIFRFAALITSELNTSADEQLGLTLPDGGLPDFEILDKLPPNIRKRVLEQCFHYCHTHDTFKE